MVKASREGHGKICVREKRKQESKKESKQERKKAVWQWNRFQQAITLLGDYNQECIFQKSLKE